jgi:hypothetical protein
LKFSLFHESSFQFRPEKVGITCWVFTSKVSQLVH